MSQNIPIYIPTFINSPEYSPARVLPRLFFYNGMIECQPWYFEITQGSFVTTAEINAFPYFDHYNVVTGNFPTTDSLSLLFNNELASYGTSPNENLYTSYYETYVELLYNPKTRLLNCSAIIPLADYFKMELNDVVNFRGNYYHLRAINDYSVKTGECNLQLLGPIIRDTFYQAPTASASSSVSWSYTENIQDGEFKVYNNAATIATLTTNGSGNTQVSESNYVTASLAPLNFPSTGSVTMSLNINGGGFNISRSTSINETISASFLVGAGQKYSITGSTTFTQLSSSISWSYTENSQDGTFTIFDNSTTIATLTANGNGNSQISQSHYVTASLVPVSYPGAGVTMSINVNGGTTLAVTGSTNTTITASFLVGAGQIYGITGSIVYNAPPTYSMDYLVVAGGGGGGTGTGGGGGAGGLKSGSFSVISNQTIPVVVGLGGAAGVNGQSSSISSSFSGFISASGGGFGGYGSSGPPANLFSTGSVGGSGGGGTGGVSNTIISGSLGTAGEGFGGGAGRQKTGNNQSAGGGGGASQTGSSYQPTDTPSGGGDGGSGSLWLNAVFYAGGGGGWYSGTGDRAGLGGPGGGGRGAGDGAAAAVTGSANTGGGGGGGASSGTYIAKGGGSGIVIIRYSNSAGQIANGGTVTNTGGFFYHAFTGSGNFTII